jgi:protoporphyrinogen oxidase
MKARSDTIILGAGMSGLGAALALRAPVYEAESRPGGVCHSFYVDEHGSPRDPARQDVSDCFRFEPAGGHWLFGAEGAASSRLSRFARFKSYTRRAAAFFPEQDWLIPFPIQEHLHGFDTALKKRILGELLAEDTNDDTPRTLQRWLLRHFGPTLCSLFFFPFNERYTAGLYDRIAPQDAYKSPIERSRIIAGAERAGTSAGYNAGFRYPEGGLDGLVRKLAAASQVHCDQRVESIDTERRVLHFAGGPSLPYRELVSSIPLDRMLRLCDADEVQRADPTSAVLVVNVAAEAGPRRPPYHWLYISEAASGMHRVGFYDQVDSAFLPAHRRLGVVSLYAERSYPGGRSPSSAEIAKACGAIIDELRAWDFIRAPIVACSTFTDPAYTWSWPGSTWVDDSLPRLARSGIRQIGRYGTWHFQGMADSFEQGFHTGVAA